LDLEVSNDAEQNDNIKLKKIFLTSASIYDSMLDAVMDSLLKSLLNRLHKKRPASTKNHVKLHYDNARPHVNNIVNNYLQQEKIKIMPHPPYSPDLAPSDFWLFNHLKHSVGTYPDATSLARALSRAVNSIPKEEYQKTFQKWIERMKLCIEHQGDYFEHLM